jgi:hypothetical protein
MAEKRPSLNVLSGPLAGQKLVIEDAVDNILIGSDPSCGMVLDTPGVSPVHARLWIDLNGATVYDTNSPFGVYVNDARVVREAPLRNGDILWLGPPGEEGSVLIQCTLPVPAAASSGSEPAASEPDSAELSESEPPAPEPSASEPTSTPSTAPAPPPVEDTSATMRFSVPAFLTDEPELEESLPPPAYGDATVVMPSGPVGGADPDLPEPEPTVSLPPVDPADLVGDLEGLEVVEEPRIASPPPVEDMGFPDFDVEPTGAVAPPPLPPPRAASPVAAPPFPEFEEDMEPTVVDAPAPTLVTPSASPSPSAAPPPEPVEAEDEAEATVMYHHTDAPVLPTPAAAAPPAATPAPAAAPAAAASTAARPAAAPSRPAAPSAPPSPAPRPPAPRSTKPAAPPGPGPATARPAIAAPRVRAERPPSAPPPPEVAAPRRSGGRGALIAASAVVISALAFTAYWFLRAAPAGAPSAEASPIAAAPPPEATLPPTMAAAPPAAPAQTLAPAPVVAATPIPEAVTVVRSPVPSPRVAAAAPAVPPTLAGPRPGAPVPAGQRPPTAAPVAPVAPAPNPAQQRAAAVSTLMTQAHAASASRNYDAAISMLDEVLKLDSQNAAALSARNAAVAARNAARRTFVSGRTVVQTEKAKGGDLAGFDSADVSVKKATDFQGRLEFAMNPPNVKPGDPYRLQVALVNEGKKAIKVSGMTFTITVNGQKSGNPIAPRVKEIAPQQRVVLEELPGVFPATANTWMAEVLVTANKGDSLKNQITWK